MVPVLPKPQLHSFVCWPLLRAPSLSVHSRQQRTEGSDDDKVASPSAVVLKKVCRPAERIFACKYDFLFWVFFVVLTPKKGGQEIYS